MKPVARALGWGIAVVTACAPRPGIEPRAAREPTRVEQHAILPASQGSETARFELEALEVPGFSPAVVSVPASDGRAKPSVVVAHGAGDRPDWHCELWSAIVAARGYVLCVRGRRTDYRVPHEHAGYYFPEHYYLGRLVVATLTAASQAYAERIDTRRAVFVGFSQGSLMGALVVAARPAQLPRALFIEGGGAAWNVPIAHRYAQRGGERVAFVCGTGWCAEPARAAVRWLDRAAIPSRLVALPGAGHTYGGDIAAELPEVFDWVVAGDPRWER